MLRYECLLPRYERGLYSCSQECGRVDQEGAEEHDKDNQFRRYRRQTQNGTGAGFRQSLPGLADTEIAGGNEIADSIRYHVQNHGSQEPLGAHGIAVFSSDAEAASDL